MKENLNQIVFPTYNYLITFPKSTNLTSNIQTSLHSFTIQKKVDSQNLHRVLWNFTLLNESCVEGFQLTLTLIIKHFYFPFSSRFLHSFLLLSSSSFLLSLILHPPLVQTDFLSTTMSFLTCLKNCVSWRNLFEYFSVFFSNRYSKFIIPTLKMIKLTFYLKVL